MIGNFKSFVVQTVHFLVIGIFMRNKEGSAYWLAIWIYTLEQQRSVILIVTHGTHRIVEGEYNELKTNF